MPGLPIQPHFVASQCLVIDAFSLDIRSLTVHLAIVAVPHSHSGKIDVEILSE
jgi:hypothetical protein